MGLNSVNPLDSLSSKKYNTIVKGICTAIFTTLSSPSHAEDKQKSHYDAGGFVTVAPNGYTGGQSEFCMLNHKNSTIIDEKFLSTSGAVCDTSLQTTNIVQTQIPQDGEFPEYSELLSEYFNGGNIKLRHAENFPDWPTEISTTNSQIIIHEGSNSLVVINAQGMMLPITFFQTS